MKMIYGHCTAVVDPDIAQTLISQGDWHEKPQGPVGMVQRPSREEALSWVKEVEEEPNKYPDEEAALRSERAKRAAITRAANRAAKG